MTALYVLHVILDTCITAAGHNYNIINRRQKLFIGRVTPLLFQLFPTHICTCIYHYPYYMDLWLHVLSASRLGPYAHDHDRPFTYKKNSAGYGIPQLQTGR